MSHIQLARLYDDFAPGLRRFLISLTGQEADARDLLQDLFIKTARQPETLVLRDPQAWLFRAARHLAIDHLRRKIRRRRAMERYAQDTPWLTATTPDLSPETVRSAIAALMTLPEEQRAVVHLKLWENLTFARIAEVMDIPPNTAASRYRYAMEHLRAALPATSCHES